MYTFEDKTKEISTKDLLRIINTNKEFIVIDISVFNVGENIKVICTDNLEKYQNVGDDGYSFIFSLYGRELHSIINILVNRYENIISSWTKNCYYYNFDEHLKKYCLSQYNFNRLRAIYNKYCNDNYITKI